MSKTNVNARQAAVSTMKLSLILAAARQIFEEDGIEVEDEKVKNFKDLLWHPNELDNKVD